MEVREIEEKLNKYIFDHKVRVYFSKKAADDLSTYKKEVQEKLIALILKRGITGPLIKPNGIGEPLGKELSGFSKIKPKHLNLN